MSYLIEKKVLLLIDEKVIVDPIRRKTDILVICLMRQIHRNAGTNRNLALTFDRQNKSHLFVHNWNLINILLRKCIDISEASVD